MRQLSLTVCTAMALTTMAPSVGANGKVGIECSKYNDVPANKIYEVSFDGIIGTNGAQTVLVDVCNCILENHDFPPIKRRNLSVSLEYEQVFNVTKANFNCTSKGAVSK